MPKIIDIQTMIVPKVLNPFEVSNIVPTTTSHVLEGLNENEGLRAIEWCARHGLVYIKIHCDIYFYIYFLAFLGLRCKTVSSNCIRRFARRCESNRETKDTIIGVEK